MQITKRLLCAGAMAVTFSLVAARAGAQNDADGNSAASGHGRGATIEVCDKTAARLAELCWQQPGCDLSKPDRS
jgi:hypothetical protein